MGIKEDEDRKKIIAELRAAAAKLPLATVEERRKYAAENKRFINLARVEEERAAGSHTSSYRTQASTQRSRLKKKKKKGHRADMESSSSDSMGDSLSEDSFSDGTLSSY